MDDKIFMEEKFQEIDTETAGITDIADILKVLCNNENLEEYAHKLYFLVELLKQKCLKLDYLHCELKYNLMNSQNNIAMYKV